MLQIVQNGGGFVGIHSASGSERDWPWFSGLLGGNFVRHAPLQDFTVEVMDRTHPSTAFLPTLEAAIAGKDVYLQKPFSLTIEEGQILRDNLQRLGTVFQVGSQQRSLNPWPHFRWACELVRNGRIGALHTVRVGLPGDSPGGDPAPMSVPDFLEYDKWLGTTPEVPYTLDRVHPLDRTSAAGYVLPDGYSRPGWLRCEQFSAGMITGWGAHHVDTAHWGMGTELTGPIEIQAQARSRAFAT